LPQGHCITPPTFWHILPSGRSKVPPIALYRVPSDPQQPLLSQLDEKRGAGCGVTDMAGDGSRSGWIWPAADGTATGGLYGVGVPLRMEADAGIAGGSAAAGATCALQVRPSSISTMATSTSLNFQSRIFHIPFWV